MYLSFDLDVSAARLRDGRVLLRQNGGGPPGALDAARQRSGLHPTGRVDRVACARAVCASPSPM